MEARLGQRIVTEARLAASDAMIAVPTMCVFLLLTPFIFVSSYALKWWRIFWRSIRQYLSPTLKIQQKMTLSTTMDTTRNHSVQTAVFLVEGLIGVKDVSDHLQYLLDVTDEGEPTHPHMKLALTTSWGCYAWVPLTKPFDIHDHIVKLPNVYQGRPITRSNAQEYLSDMIKVFLPSDIPPWQVALLHIIGEDICTYVLVRVREALLVADDLQFGDFLPVDMTSRTITPCSDDSTSTSTLQRSESPLATPEPSMKALTAVYDAAHASGLKYLKRYDPAFSSEDQSLDDAGFLTAAWTLVTAAVLLMSAGEPEGPQRAREAYLRRAPTVLFAALYRSLSLRSAARAAIAACWASVVRCVATVPLAATREAVMTAGGRWKQTRTGELSAAVTDASLLTSEAVHEATGLARAAFAFPRIVYDIVRNAWDVPPHRLQTTSLCGRKVFAWSTPIKPATLERACRAQGATADEVALAALARTLSVFTNPLGHPKHGHGHHNNFGVLSMHNHHQKHMLELHRHVMSVSMRVLDTEDVFGCSSSTGAWLCLDLPTDAPANELIQRTRQALRVSRRRQKPLSVAAAVFERLALWCLPSLVVRIVLNVVTRQYPVALTLLRQDPPEHALEFCGRKVEAAYTWRPAHGRICLSLTLTQNNGGLQLGIMADAEIEPSPPIIAITFERIVKEMTWIAPHLRKS